MVSFPVQNKMSLKKQKNFSFFLNKSIYKQSIHIKNGDMKGSEHMLNKEPLWADHS